MSIIEIIGVDSPYLDESKLAIIRRCGVVIASSRHKPLLEGEKVTILPIAPVNKMLNDLDKSLQEGDVAVLASGDPLFFGVARTLITKYGSERITVHPALSAVQLACTEFKLPWDDMTILSLHGREPGDLPARILPHNKVMLFTDHRNSPDQVAASLLNTLQTLQDDKRIQNISVRVAENLGMKEQKITVAGLADIADSTFGPLNIMLVEQAMLPETKPVFGLTENEITHSRGLITKDEVRAITLHCLRLPGEGVLWDVGGGSGSISV
ncbi:MAG: precorrin-6y C5,15-methyltransferase (decarboxylating) subunit CbiE, partial [Desulfobulbaceae bacterium]|nr:precorrin-6y C5,15-methyltransferase (decarboxylating) subunit CbiE [Desulfobulbaceae bacterium]